MITKYINGDITETELKYIAHGVNCQNQMNSGVAKALFTKWPSVKEQYHAYMNALNEKGRKPQDYLGTFHEVEVEPGKFVLNLFSQLNYGYDGQRYVDYYATITALKFISPIWDGSPIAIPKIGCGLAGGNWTFMEMLLNDFSRDRIELWVYDNSIVKPNGKNDFA